MVFFTLTQNFTKQLAILIASILILDCFLSVTDNSFHPGGGRPSQLLEHTQLSFMFNP
jgi:hypothetical protein